MEEERDTDTSLAVIIPTYNGERHIADLLQSIVAQNVSDFSVILSDNGSTDETLTRVAGFKNSLNLTVLDSSEKPGKAHALNRAVAVSTAKKLIFIDQDDTINEQYVLSMSEALDQTPLVAAAMDTEKHNSLHKILPRVAPFDQKIGQFPVKLAAGGTLGVRREAFYDIGKFNEEFNFSTNDVEFCCRAHYRGYDLQLVRDAILHYRFRESIIDNFYQGIYYGKGNYEIARTHPEVRGDQEATTRLAINTARLLGCFLYNSKSRARSAHLIGKNIGQLSAKLNGST